MRKTSQIIQKKKKKSVVYISKKGKVGPRLSYTDI